ncbi:SpaH/EbpB family LPXTG-anchored major pilin [Alkalibacillus almallahensis]|uniref:SpaH/EbpB family LPXTG-anchored major pilin n=1 Tax=Alkalibacillus almallahensis TaxID=1379154 RepID=UPI00141E0116|nr:SpaH/EbpB family LPXTG-anchored major pilin [Alkalibacillus almallahensis]NIK13176.1 fimbrial isopeptide formation D2 family protein/LPXTG-motif cell wall-anchored protein [Alkalibacillus almallahensis]
MTKKWFSVSMIFALVFTLLVPFGALSADSQGEDGVRETGSLTIYKYALENDELDNGEPGTGEPEQGVPEEAEELDGVVFKITQTHKFDPGQNVWTDDFDEPFVDYSDETVNGMTSFENLPLGRYTVVEHSGPDHVNLNPEEFTVEIPMTSEDGSSVNYDVVIYPKNELIRGAVQLQKVDETGEPMAGVNFTLHGENLDEGQGTQFTTNEAGVIQVDGLRYGDYYFTEDAPPSGYVGTGDHQHEFSITESGSIVNVDPSGQIEDVMVTNFPETTITKTNDVGEGGINRGVDFDYTLTIDIPEDIASYEQFEIVDELDENLNFSGFGDITADGEDVSEAFESSEINSTLKWNATDFNMLDGKNELKINFTVQINGDANESAIENSAEVQYENEYNVNGTVESNTTEVTPTIGSITLFKRDSENEKLLDGAEFQLWGDSENKIEDVKSGDNGEFHWDDLDYGQYYLEEVKAPNGYKLPQKMFSVEVSGDEGDVTITIDNVKSDHELPATGGIGTSLFTAIGLTLMIIALVIYFRRRHQLA